MSLTLGNTALQLSDQVEPQTNLQALDFADLALVLKQQRVDVFTTLSGKERDVLFGKREWLRAVWDKYEQLTARGNGGMETAVTMVALHKPKCGIELATAGKLGADARTYRNALAWFTKLGKKSGKPDWKNWKALAPNWCREQELNLNPDFLYAVMQLYLHPNAPKLKPCFRKIARVWRADGSNQAEIPTYDRVRYYAATRISPQVRDKYRGVRNLYSDRRKGYIIRECNFEVGECWFGDHRIADFWVREPHPDNPAEFIAVRPYVTAITDARSGYIIAITIYADQYPNHERILETFQNALIKTNSTPLYWYIDRGTDFLKQGFVTPVTLKTARGELLHDATDTPYRYSVLTALRVKLRKARGYNAKEKDVEGIFGTIGGDFDKTQPGYCGSDTKSRPDKKETWQGDVMRLPNIQEATEQLADWVDNEYHRFEREDGRTRQQMWDDRPSGAERALDPQELFLGLLMPHARAAKVTRTGVGSCGVRFGGWTYSHISLHKYVDKWVMVKTYWGTPAVARKGKQVAGAIFIYRADDTLICAAVAEHTAMMIAETDEEREKLGRLQHIINTVAKLDTDEFEIHTGKRQITSPDKVLQYLPGHAVATDRVVLQATTKPNRRLKSPPGAAVPPSAPPPATSAMLDFHASMMAGPNEPDEETPGTGFSPFAD